MEEKQNKEWTKDQNVHTKIIGVQCKNNFDEIIGWKTIRIKENNWSLGSYKEKMGRNNVPLQTTTWGFR